MLISTLIVALLYHDAPRAVSDLTFRVGLTHRVARIVWSGSGHWAWVGKTVWYMMVARGGVGEGLWMDEVSAMQTLEVVPCPCRVSEVACARVSTLPSKAHVCRTVMA